MMREGEELLVTGVVRALAPPLRAPLSGEPCVMHVSHARVWSQLDYAGALVDELVVTDSVPFVLETEGGGVVVDATHGELAARVQQFWPPHPAALRALLATRNVAHLIGSTFADHRLARPGDRLRVRGIAMRERVGADGERGYRDDAERFVLVGYPRRAMRLTRVD